MRARDVMTPTVVTVGPEHSVGHVAELLTVHRISAVPVVDEAGALVGIVSESDFLPQVEGRPSRRWWLRLFTSVAVDAREYVRAHGQRVGEVMTRDVVTVAPEATLGEIAHTLEVRRVKRVPVVEGGRIVGLVSRADIVRAIAARKTEPMPAAPRSDSAVREEVLAAVADFDWAASARVTVTVTGSIVTIYGVFDHQAQCDALQVAAENVPGVSKVEMHARGWPTQICAQ